MLNDISAAVPIGKIYALLGASGCGKTTLLKCLLGRLKPPSGDILVFGQRPGSKKALVPGPAVGYMPQDIGLFDKFTIYETVRYFAEICGE